MIERTERTISHNGGTDIRTSHSGSNGEGCWTTTGSQNGHVVGLLQVARSTKPEHDALSNLLGALLVCALAGLLLAAVGGWFLAGKSLAPVRDAFEHQRTFVADASHELRTPLAVIRANAEYLQLEQPDNAEVHEIVRESDRLGDLVDSLLALARGDRSRGARQRIVFDLGKEVEDAVARWSRSRPSAARADRLHHPAGRARRPRADPPADRHPAGQRAALHRPGGRVHVQTAADGSNALITVHDTGIGIREEARAPRVRALLPRRRGPQPRVGRHRPGAGDRARAGRPARRQITVDSAKGIGTTFVVRLPLAKAALDRIER